MPKKLTSIFLRKSLQLLEEKVSTEDANANLMYKAGLFAAQNIQKIAQDSKKPIVFFIGPGNNGGDGIVAATILKKKHFNILIYLTVNKDKFKSDLYNLLDKWEDCGGTYIQEIPKKPSWQLLIDAIFGIGLNKEIRGTYLNLISQINSLDVTKISLDIPSGIDCDTGRVLGDAIKAKYTLSFLRQKPGIFMNDGNDYCGKAMFSNLGEDKNYNLKHGKLIDENIFKDLIPSRNKNSHKGTYGTVHIFGGNKGMVGSILLSGKAALYLGSGKVKLGILAPNFQNLEIYQPEVMINKFDDLLKEDQEVDCVVVGPGLGRDENALTTLNHLIKVNAPLIIDADALLLLSDSKTMQNEINQRSSPTIITPHPKEASYLLACTTNEIQHDRISAATELGKKYKCNVILKGNGTVCHLPDRGWFINKSGNPGMASPGMGDVLCGIISAFISQKVHINDAVLSSVFLHGLACDSIAKKMGGNIGITASESISAARKLLNKQFIAVK